MTKADVVARVCDATGCTKIEAYDIVEEVFSAM